MSRDPELDQLFSDVLAAIDQTKTRLDPPRFRYFARGRGAMFCWTTEKASGDLYASFAYQPVGRGSRSGSAERWQLVDESISAHLLRRDAKARALRMFNSYQAGTSRPWL